MFFKRIIFAVSVKYTFFSEAVEYLSDYDYQKDTEEAQAADKEFYCEFVSDLQKFFEI